MSTEKHCMEQSGTKTIYGEVEKIINSYYLNLQLKCKYPPPQEWTFQNENEHMLVRNTHTHSLMPDPELKISFAGQ